MKSIHTDGRMNGGKIASALNTHLEGMAWGGSSLFKDLLLYKGNNVHIEGSRATTAPVKEKDVSRPGK